MRGLRRGAPARLLALAACEARSPGCGRNSILRAAGQPVGGSAVPVGRSRGSAPCRRDMAARPMPPGPRDCGAEPVARYQRSPKYRTSQELRRHGGPGRRVLHCAGRRDLRDPRARRRRPDRHGRVHPGPGTPGSGRAGVPGLNPAGDRGEPRQRRGAQLQDSQLPGRPGRATCSSCTAGHRLARRSRHRPAGLVPDLSIGLDLIARTHSCQGRGASLTHSSAP